MDVIYENIEEYNPNKKHKILITFDGMIANILSNKKLIPITELFIRGRKINISLVFITQSYFDVPKNIRIHSTLYNIQYIQYFTNYSFHHKLNEACLLVINIVCTSYLMSLRFFGAAHI